ncbi:noncanonical pyrimidine nucleotidase, YjjG family [Flavobacteriales bacterium 34_180_T64]|nr:noncanonical pyrimidine nucleotidase, YjjG family [Flavobacteriales bacterium 34_180_T64]
MKIKDIKHIFFDLDHTLWDFDKNSSLAFDKIFKLHNVTVNTTDFLSVYEPINFDYWRLYREEKVSKSNLRYGRLKDSFDAINFEVSDQLIDLLSVDYINYLTTFNHLLKGSIEILQYLQPKYELHIITNGFEEAQIRKMNSSNIRHYFKTITNSEMAGVKKPNPIIFDFALNVANASAHESLMIGDNYEADIIGALEVGFDAIYYNYHNHDPEPHIKEIKDLVDLKMYL